MLINITGGSHDDDCGEMCFKLHGNTNRSCRTWSPVSGLAGSLLQDLLMCWILKLFGSDMQGLCTCDAICAGY